MRALLALCSLLGSASSASADARVLTRPHDGITLVQQIIHDEPTQSASESRAESRTIYLNRTGVTLKPGPNDSRTNHSSLIARPSSIPGWEVSPELWSETVACLRDLYAPFDVTITESDPGDIAHIEAVFGGSAVALGLPVRAGGVSPRSTRCNVIESSIVFAFTDDLPASSKTICEVMAQEIAHSYGLDHELLPEDPMTYLSHAGRRSFQNTVAECGELTPRACGVPGYASCRATQNSYALLVERLGEAGANEQTDDGDATTDDPSVGCTSGRGHGWLGCLLALVVLPRRARRTRAQEPAKLTGSDFYRVAIVADDVPGTREHLAARGTRSIRKEPIRGTATRARRGTRASP